MTDDSRAIEVRSDVKGENAHLPSSGKTKVKVKTKINRATILFSTVAVGSIFLLIYLIGTVDMYMAAGCAFSATLWLLWTSKRKIRRKELGRERGLAPILLVALAPLVGSLILSSLGYMGPPAETLLRIIMTVGFSISIFVGTFPLPLAMMFKIQESRQQDGESYSYSYRPLVTIHVPAYNEGEVISRTLESLMNLKYENKEIIVIDDGSTDLTSIIASWYKRLGVKVLRKPNGGKASALNYGLLFARGEIVITIDSDSMVEREAIDRIVRIMGDEKVAAVAGNIRVLNSKSTITRIQELEYMMGINVVRRAFALYGSVMVVPGAFGAFRRNETIQAGGYDTDTLTEDFDLTIKLLKTGLQVGSSSTGLGFTEVPSTWKVLYKQRLRWSTGTYQTIFKHRDAIWNRRYGLLHSLVFPMILLSLFNPITSFVALGAGIYLALTGGLLVFLKLELLFLAVQVFVALVALSIDNEKYKLALYSPFFVVIYKQFLDYTTIVSAFRAIFGKSHHWHKIDRSGGMQTIKVYGKA